MIAIILAIAIAPGVAIAILIYKMDKYEREPFKLLLKSFVYGLFSIGVTLILSYLLELITPSFDNPFVQEGVHAFFGVALVEETSKFIFLIFLLYPHKEFNEPYDGIVYAIMIGMGFATLENIIYSVQSGLSVALVRMFTAVPSHATFAILMGYFAGMAKFKVKRRSYALIGLLMATLFHGFYDFFIFISHIPGVIIGSFVSLAIAVWLSVKAIKSSTKASPFKPL